MKCRWIKLCQWLLGVLGISTSISSCTPESGFMRVEYGQPNMDFSVKGKVVDAETGAGVPGIEIAHERWNTQIDTTGIDGSFELSGSAFPGTELKVFLKDIDPEKDGRYKDTEASIKLVQVKPGSGHWYEGTFEADDAVIRIEKQKEE